MAILNKFRNKLKIWRTHSLSLIGRVNVVKVVCLPQLQHLFHNLSVYLTKPTLKN